MTDLADLAGEEFVSLTTYRRSGDPVSIPVWVAPAPDFDPTGALVITTMADSGKVKRIRHDRRVRLRPCARHGEVAPSAPTVDAVAEVISDHERVRLSREPLRAKYGERMGVNEADAPDPPLGVEPARVILRVTPVDPGESRR